jgi:hypothetical protein
MWDADIPTGRPSSWTVTHSSLLGRGEVGGLERAKFVERQQLGAIFGRREVGALARRAAGLVSRLPRSERARHVGS